MNETDTSKSAGGTGKHLLDELWTAGVGGASRFRRAAVTVARVGYITVEGFIQDLCLIRASALTFASLMALVPTLAIGFAFDGQEAEGLPVEPTDQRLDMIVTETRVLTFG